MTSSTDQETADSIDRQGRMLKYLYPKDKGWANHEDRKRRRSIVTELEREHRMLAKESLVLDVNIAAAKAERDRAFESRRLGELEAHVQADTDVADLNAQALAWCTREAAARPCPEDRTRTVRPPASSRSIWISSTASSGDRRCVDRA